MTLDLSKYENAVEQERKLPIIFLVNEKVCDCSGWVGCSCKKAISDIMLNLEYSGVKAEMALVSFGDGVKLVSGYKPFSEYTDADWPAERREGRQMLGPGLMLVKDFIEDKDCTPEGNYDPVVILFSNSEVTSEYEESLQYLGADGRFSSEDAPLQRIGISHFECDNNFYMLNHIGSYNNISPLNLIESKIPNTLKLFAERKVALLIQDTWDDSWCTVKAWSRLADKEGATHFSPVLDMIELRYRKDGKRVSRRIPDRRSKC